MALSNRKYVVVNESTGRVIDGGCRLGRLARRVRKAHPRSKMLTIHTHDGRVLDVDHAITVARLLRQTNKRVAA